MQVHVRQRRGCGCFGCLSTGLTLGVSLFAGLAVFGLIGAMPNGGEAEVLAALAACPAAVEALGSPIERPTLAPGCGSQESGAGVGNASWSFRVAGPRGSGDLTYTARFEANGPWQVTSALLEVRGKGIAVVPCSSAREAPEEQPERERPERERPKRGEERRPGRR